MPTYLPACLQTLRCPPTPPHPRPAARRRELLNYIVFLRVTPILPNTFINVASPIVGVPLAPFALGELTAASAMRAGGRMAAQRGGEAAHPRTLACPGSMCASELLCISLNPYVPRRHAAGLPAQQLFCGERRQPPGRAPLPLRPVSAGCGCWGDECRFASMPGMPVAFRRA